MKPRKSTRNLDALDLVDRISNLPDSIHGLILSNLPAKEAVATSILSKSWRTAWMTVHNLDFCLDGRMNELPEDADMKFVRFVNQVLLLHDGELLKKFGLFWRPKFIPAQVISWINIAITRNVHEFFLCVEGPEVHQTDADVWNSVRMLEPLEMPVSLFSCDSLQSLELNGCICVSNAIVVCLPRLETLKLVSVDFESTEAFEELICGCPMLNYLKIDMELDKMITYSKYDNDVHYIISSTSLRRLDVHVNYGNGGDYPSPSLRLEASSLEYLKVDGFTPEVIVEGTLSSLVEVDFRIYFLSCAFSEDFCNTVAEAVDAFDGVKVLTLSVGALWALRNATKSLSTKFKRLTKLKAGAISCHCSSLLDFFQSLDSIEVLTIEQDDASVDEFDIDYTKWIAPAEVPRCLSNSLKEISLECYIGFADEREMVGYLLKHGGALEVMRVTCCVKNWYCRSENWKDLYLELVEELRRFPRKSPACKLEVSWREDFCSVAQG